MLQKAYEGVMWCNWKLWSSQFYHIRHSGLANCSLFICWFGLWAVYGISSTSKDPFQDKESVGNLVKLIDKSNGYIFAGIEASAVEFSKIAVGPVDWDYYRYPI